MKSVFHLLVGLLILAIFSGCAQRKQYTSSSVVEYLYSNKQVKETPTVPVLSLPLKVGIAFVPESNRYRSALTETDKEKLLDTVAKSFKKYAYIDTIEIIPSAYLRARGGFTNLDQIRTMYGVDVIALVSYDQHQFTDQNFLTLTYWTLLGMYIVPGEENDTHTMVDAVVYDIASKKLLFRAPGVSHIKGVATPINLSKMLREDSREGFMKASEELIVNLNKELQKFKEKVKQSPKEYCVTHKQGYRGGGTINIGFLLLLGVVGGYGFWYRKNY
jgi:rhombotail lipoprotein